MLQRRSSLIAAGSGGGLALGALCWLAFARGAPAAERMDALQERIDGLRAPASASQTAFDAANLSAAPIFALTTGPGAVSDPVLALQGIAKAGGRASALLTIDGKPPEWLSEGQTRDGVTLQEVRAASVLVDTVTGTKEVALGQKTGTPPASSAPGAPAAGAPGSAGPPAGYRLPPAPANAPGG
ncbi:hypothetical protein ACO2Q3_12640 [Caulobacter sp. KR2-114]|uniref:hypothetical protein n=1 Tax=Caulobacter sp. KR2-114 TaxID=3400912 RepID=UPI003BFCAE79